MQRYNKDSRDPTPHKNEKFVKCLNVWDWIWIYFKEMAIV